MAVGAFGFFATRGLAARVVESRQPLDGVTSQTRVGEITGLGFWGTQLGAFTLTP